MSNLGQLVFTGISGTILTDEEKNFIEKENIGGVILFSENYESPAQLAELVNSIQALREEYPLFIAVDHEGGRVVRFKNHFTKIPAMLELAKTESPKLCFKVLKLMAEELAICGVNVNLSPVCDVLSNKDNKVIGDRAFGSDPGKVSAFVSSAIRGLQTNGVLACAKHFPGHGDTSIDSHFNLPIIKKNMEDLKSMDLPPFVKAIKARVEFVMMAHVIIEGLDPELPCSLSSKAYDLLRDELRFTKLIITDDMQMKAIADRYSTSDAAAMAIIAGADIIEYRDMNHAKLGLEGLKEAVKNKTLKVDQVKKKYDRILECKKTYLSEYTPNYIPDINKVVGIKSSENLIKEVHEKIEFISQE
ncbi:MAG: beta-N-acetylhexosaminidase [Bacteriovoracaceae bacterium]|nr:beta-N-acetylhexosaminidase [Bacteriovoracaceae bacterium]